MTFPQKLIYLMRSKGLSQEALGDALKLSHVAVGGWLRGAIPRAKTAKRIADYFKVPVAELLDDTVDLEQVRTEKKVADQVGLTVTASGTMAKGTKKEQRRAALVAEIEVVDEAISSLATLRRSLGARLENEFPERD